MATPEASKDSVPLTRFGRILRVLLYALCTALFFYVQLRVVLQFLAGSGSLTHVLIGLFAVKLGEAAHEKIGGGWFPVWLSLLSGSSFVLLLSTGPIHYGAYFLFALSAMKVRDTFFFSLDRRVKVWSRAIGFVLAPFTNTMVYATAVLVILLLGLVLLVRKDSDAVKPNPWVYRTVLVRHNLPVYYAMFLHHCHYFAYAYSIPLILAADSSIPLALYGAIFYVGWVAYNAYERFLRPSWKWFILGHLLSLGALAGLYLFPSKEYLTVLFWLLTGLGSGTVYMIPSLVLAPGRHVTTDLRIAEIYGHLVGLACWSLLVVQAPAHTFLASAAILVLLLGLSFYVAGKGAAQRVQV